VLPHLPPCGQTRCIARGLDEKFGPGCSGLDNVFSKGGIIQWIKEGIRLTISPEGGGLDFEPLLFPLLARMRVGGAKL